MIQTTVQMVEMETYSLIHEVVTNAPHRFYSASCSSRIPQRSDDGGDVQRCCKCTFSLTP